jgi:hypothetical protein
LPALRWSPRTAAADDDVREGSADTGPAATGGASLTGACSGSGSFVRSMDRYYSRSGAVSACHREPPRSMDRAMTTQATRLRIESVEPLDGYRLRLSFNDGATRVVDLEPELWGPIFEPLRDASVFRQVAVDHELGTIVWPNGADMDPHVLHGDQPAAP